MEELNLDELRATYDHPADKSVIELIDRLEQAEQDRVKMRNRLDAMRRQRDGYRNQLRKTEQQIQSVREAATAMATHSLPEAPRGGAWETAHGAQLFAKDILEALGGEERG